MKIHSIILAAGEGKRMQSNIPKPLHKICGRAMLDIVIDAAKNAGSSCETVVIGFEREKIEEHLDNSVKYAIQNELLGTGHAVMMAFDSITEPLDLRNDCEITMVLCGDSPLITSETLRSAIELHISSKSSATVVTADCENPYGYGRIVRDNGLVREIVEEKDADEKTKTISEINSGFYIFETGALKNALSKITNKNAQNEYYLTQVIEIILQSGGKVSAFKTNFENVIGVNDRIQLANAAKILNSRIIKDLMLSGVTIIDPSNTYVSCETKIGRDSIIYPGTIIEGSTVIGENTVIYASKICDSKIGGNNKVINSVIDSAEVGDFNSVGPFAYLRPKTKIKNHARIGDFVEIKNSSVGDGTKISHLTYVGDAEVGSDVNIGCGTVVVNYDGKFKHRSKIMDGAFIGCNTNLISPVTVGEKAYTAAGSTITDDVPDRALAIARERQTNKENWKRKN